jgi:MarR family transcriptional regulator, lower aerobic nicotinate degradation pathway regulator
MGDANDRVTVRGMELAPTRLRTLPSWLINQTAIPAQRLVAAGLAERGASRQQYALLAALDERGPASQAALGRTGGIDPSDMVALVNDLVEQGLVARTPDPTDRRRNVVALTAAGHRRLEQLDAEVAKLQDDLLAPLTATERRQLVHLLTKLVDHHRQPVSG